MCVPAEAAQQNTGCNSGSKQFAWEPLHLAGTDVGGHVLRRRVVRGRRCICSLSLFTTASVKTEDALVPVPRCHVVPAGCACQTAPRTGPPRPPPDAKLQLSHGFLHLHAKSRCQVDSSFHPKGCPGCVHCSEPWQPCRSPAPVEGVADAPGRGLCCRWDPAGGSGCMDQEVFQFHGMK